MKRIIYTSIARKGLELADCAHILKGAAENNARQGITGVLLLSNETFLQYLEGPASGIEQTMAVIRRDRRHHHFTVLVDEAHAPPTRLFAQWQMGFHHVSAAESALGPGLLRNDDLAPMLNLRSAARDDLCARLLSAFWESNSPTMAGRGHGTPSTGELAATQA